MILFLHLKNSWSFDRKPKTPNPWKIDGQKTVNFRKETWKRDRGGERMGKVFSPGVRIHDNERRYMNHERQTNWWGHRWREDGRQCSGAQVIAQLVQPWNPHLHPLAAAAGAAVGGPVQAGLLARRWWIGPLPTRGTVDWQWETRSFFQKGRIEKGWLVGRVI